MNDLDDEDVFGRREEPPVVVRLDDRGEARELRFDVSRSVELLGVADDALVSL